MTDNGRGIPAELLPRIFDMFVQERTTPDGTGGLGLGLGLVKRLVELHGGTRPRGERGPRQGRDVRGAAAARRGRGPRAASRRARTRDRRSARCARSSCDDAADLRELVADLLRMKGHEVTVVEDGPSAVALICAEKPDVALIDIGLPDMDGYEVARTAPPRA